MVSGLKGRTYVERLDELDLPSLELRRRHFDMAQVYKIVNGKDHVERSTWFEMTGTDPTRMTRLTQDPNNIKKQSPKTDLRKYFFSNRVVEDWNKLPSEVKICRSVKAFKNEMVKHIK